MSRHDGQRLMLAEQLSAAIERARAEARTVSILMMDLDRFKYVNDRLGHGVGDHVLLAVASRLSQTCSFAQCISRLGGDEFAVLLTGAAASKVSEIAQEIVSALERPVVYQDQPLDVGASVGIAQFPQHGTDAQTLVRNADIAMYVAKRNKSGVVTYQPDYDSMQQAHLFMLGDLRRAIERHELRLVYQPKVSLQSINVSSVEALVRWNHPERGQINSDLATIVRSTIELGHNLGMKVVAEGVEDSRGWELLKSLGCDHAQGYFMSRPLDPEALVKRLAAQASRTEDPNVTSRRMSA